MKRCRSGPSAAAFSKIELLAVILIAAIIALLAWPAISSALRKRDLTRAMNNARELYVVGFRMATDGAAKSDANLAWPGDYPQATLADYCAKLIERDYVKPADLQRILSAPGAECTIATSGAPAMTTITGKSALKVYTVKAADSSETLFAASANYTYNTALDPRAVPFGDAGFVVVHKSGDAGIFGKNQATPAGFENSVERFQSAPGIGKLPGVADGAMSSGDGGTVLAAP